MFASSFLSRARIGFFLAGLLTFPGISIAAAVQAPALRLHLTNTGTSWFASPIVHNLGSGDAKIIGTFYDIIVWDKNGAQLARVTHGNGQPLQGRIYAPAICGDLDGDGIFEIIAGSGSNVAAYEWRNNTLVLKAGWPASTCSAGQCPEVRGLAAGDLDRNGTIEIVATTTQTNSKGAQVFVFSSNGTLYQPGGISWQAWPRFNTATGLGNDGDVNGAGHTGYGCYGLNVGLGNLDDDPELEIVVTFDDHQINVFNHTWVSMLASPWFTNRQSDFAGNRLDWGQFIRWFDPQVEENHYHLHTGDWPDINQSKWLQWTQSPPSVADINLDGKNEVVAIPNVELGEPYVTQHDSVMVLEGAYGNGDRSARRLPSWEQLPSSGPPLPRTLDWYPPANPPAPTIVNISGDARPEILYAAHDGFIYCLAADSHVLWRRDIRHGRALMYSSEITVADLNRDHVPELILTTYGDPESVRPGQTHGFLMILDNSGQVLFDRQLPEQGTNGNGKGAPAAPTVQDIDGDDTLEILVPTFGAGLFIYTVAGSDTGQLLWPTARGNFLRNGRAWGKNDQPLPGPRPSGDRGQAILTPVYLLLSR